jgi:hypothetical protein
MTVTSSGLRCDVCGGFILPVFDDDYEEFGVTGIGGRLSCHAHCKIALQGCGNDWTRLPPGPLRTAFEGAAALGGQP